jgi:hypothetical protein
MWATPAISGVSAGPVAPNRVSEADELREYARIPGKLTELCMKDSNSKMSSEIIPLKSPTDFRESVEFWPQHRVTPANHPAKQAGGPFLSQRGAIRSQVEAPLLYPDGQDPTFGTAGGLFRVFGTQYEPLCTYPPEHWPDLGCGKGSASAGLASAMVRMMANVLVIGQPPTAQATGMATRP